MSKIKENKHPFALYGWGERQMDMGSQKTHNVCASASVHEVCLERGPALPRGASMAVVLGATGGPWVMWGFMEAKRRELWS